MKRFAIFAAAALALSVAKPASAAVIYTINANLFPAGAGQLEFTAPTILTSAAVVNMFSGSATVNGFPVVSIAIAPVSGENCFGLGGIPGPCVAIEEVNLVFVSFRRNFDPGDPPLTALGSYYGGALVISSSSVPEPATLALLGLALSGLGLTRRRKSN